MARSPLLAKIRAPHRDARRTLSTPTRRAPHFFPCARLCATFLGSSTPHRTLCPLLCFAPLSSRWTLLSRVRVAICISIVVVHVGRRLRSLVQPSNVDSWISPTSTLLGELGGLARCAARKAARVFLDRTGVRGLTKATRKAAEGSSAHFVACDSFSLLFY